MLRNLLKSMFGGASGAKPEAQAGALYLELMKLCLTNSIYDDDLDLRTGTSVLDPASGRILPVEGGAASASAKHHGAIWPSRAHTMVGIPRLNNLQHCIEDVLARGIPGDLIETGVWRGGASIFMRAVLKAHGMTDRTVWAADSFEGLPVADQTKHPYDFELKLHKAAALAVSLEEVQRNFERYGLMDTQVRFLKGWFSDTLPTAPIVRLAVLRLDGDHYESTMDALNSLYGKLSVGGYVIVDDYNVVEGCNIAIADFRRQHAIGDELLTIPGGGAYWRRGK